ncbi:Sodium/calcium exchanger protein-domain-containing protein, partial [Linnemannia elongata]
QCEDIWNQPDRCAFVRENCADYPAGLINYLHFYFCDLSHVPAAATFLLCAWLIFLFGFVGVAASDFFCPNLSTIAKKLHLSESMTGVTFLAFGNGSPDVFSTFSAMGAGSGSLAIGELVGAASFITSVVVGSMAIIKPFKVSRAPFLRDVIFFAGCVLFTLYTVVDGKITLFESLFLIAYYVFYVAFVVIGNWRHQKLKAERDLEERARNLYEDDGDDIDEDALGADEEQGLLSHGGSQRGPSNEGAEDSISLRPHGAPAFKRRPSLVAAFEFNDVVRSLSLSGSRPRLQSFDPSYYGTKSPRSPRVSRRESSRSSRPVSIHTPQEGSRPPGLQEPSTRMQRFKEYLQAIRPIYFPTLLDWDQKSLFVKFLAITSLPMVLLLTLTLPVVELCDEDEGESQNNSPVTVTSQEARRLPKIVIGDKPEEEIRYDGWSRTATTVQMILAPVFVATVISSAAQDGYISIAVALVVGIALSFLVHRFSSEETPPRFYGAFCFAGFMVAITWIFLVANEVVGVLQAFGMIFGVSDAILGLTIFAMGNSLGDLVANITIARMGFPRMAFSACFGGPLLNMLLGVGISGTYMTVKTGTPIPLQVSPTLFVSIIGVLVTLLTAMVVVPRNGYVMSRTWGWFLLAMYTTCTIINVAIEIKHGKKSE